MNNLKLIREIYGATQEQIAEAIGVNRVTVANWESGSSTASSSNRERMSIYYGIGPEYFYDKEIDENIKNMLQESAARAREVASKSGGKRSKEADYNKLFSSISFAETMKRYMFAMKMMLAIADEGELDKLETAFLINQKMGERLKALIDIRKKENTEGVPSLKELLDEFE